MLAPEGESSLGLESTSPVGGIEGDERQLLKLGAAFRVVACAPGRIQKLERDGIAKRDLVELNERRPSCRDASTGFASVPRAGVGEIARHYGSRSRRSSSGEGPSPPSRSIRLR